MLENSPKTRSEHVAQNAVFGILGQVLTTLFSFISRTVFIYTLGKEYLGINGLFTNVLLILSFAELGIGNAMVYSMYKPLKERDEEKLKSILLFYKKAYQVIGIVVLFIGLAILPFLRYLIKGDIPDTDENLKLIYLLFLANTVVSYFYVYKRSIIVADQNDYITTIYSQVFVLIQTVLQILVLILFKDFVLYLVILIICSFFCNVALAKKANRMYPFILEPAKELDKDSKHAIINNVKALSVYKFASVVLNGTANIILSALFGLSVVGVYYNYTFFIQFFSSLLSKITNAFTASVGNLNTESIPEKQYSVFRQLFFVCVWSFGLASMGLLLLHKEVIELWIGPEYIFSNSIVFAIVLQFYVNAVSFAAYTYRTTLGLFIQGWYAPALAAIINIVLAIILGRKIGISGVFYANAIARFITIGIVDPYLIYKRAFYLHPIRYYLMYFKYLLLFVPLYICLYHIIGIVSVTGWWGVIIKILIVFVLYNLTMIALFRRTNEYRALKSTIMMIINRVVKRTV